jgi:hypothetical protein
VNVAPSVCSTIWLKTLQLPNVATFADDSLCRSRIASSTVPVIRDGKETFPLVPVAVGLYSTAFNIFNKLLLFPFVGVFERMLSRIGKDASEEVEDYSAAWIPPAAATPRPVFRSFSRR